jgi:hypothetical protein
VHARAREREHRRLGGGDAGDYNDCHGFTTGFESRGAHGSEKQWNLRETRV